MVTRSCPSRLVNVVCAPKHLVEHEDAPHVAVQVVFGGEADAGEDLLAVAGGGAGTAPGGALAMAAVTGD